MNDLAVDMGLDPETARVLREVAHWKDAAVAEEDFPRVSPPPPFVSQFVFKSLFATGPLSFS